MFDYSFTGIISQISGLSTFGILYLFGAGFLFGAVAGFYWRMRQAIVIGAIVTALFFLYLSYQSTGVITDVIPTFLSLFKGILYTLVGIVFGALLSFLVFNSNR